MKPQRPLGPPALAQNDPNVQLWWSTALDRDHNLKDTTEKKRNNLGLERDKKTRHFGRRTPWSPLPPLRPTPFSPTFLWVWPPHLRPLLTRTLWATTVCRFGPLTLPSHTSSSSPSAPVFFFSSKAVQVRLVWSGIGLNRSGPERSDLNISGLNRSLPGLQERRREEISPGMGGKGRI